MISSIIIDYIIFFVFLEKYFFYILCYIDEVPKLNFFFFYFLLKPGDKVKYD
jgi:hypothetical protein